MCKEYTVKYRVAINNMHTTVRWRRTGVTIFNNNKTTVLVVEFICFHKNVK